MAFSLGFHIVFAVFGMGLPWLLLFIEDRFIRTGDRVWYEMARRWCEAFAFFLEAIFLGLYLYGWDRLPPRTHWWTGVPVAVSGMASALFVTTANAWMNTPVGFVEENGVVVSAEPIAPLIAPAAPHQVLHMNLAALLCTGFGV